MSDFEITEIENEHSRMIEEERIARQEDEERRIEELQIAEINRIQIAADAVVLQAMIAENAINDEIEANILYRNNEPWIADIRNQGVQRVIPNPIRNALPLVSPLPSPSFYPNYDDNDVDTQFTSTYHTSEEEEEPYEEGEPGERLSNSEEEDYQRALTNSPDIEPETEAEDNNSDTDCESFGSARSNNPSEPSPPNLQMIQPFPPHPLTKPLRINDTSFLDKLNNYNKTSNANSRYIISSVRPSGSNPSIQDHFLCHLCHSLPKIGPLPKEGLLWKRDTHEHPFARNIASIFRHLSIHHCNRPKIDRQINANAEHYILTRKIEHIKCPNTSLFHTTTSIPKAFSTSCLNTAWKSNQTEITQPFANAYYLSGICPGHTKKVDTKGVAYVNDLANSVYCSCNAIPRQFSEKTLAFLLSDIRAGTRSRPMPLYYHDDKKAEITEDTVQTFFNLEKTSIHHSHPIFVCKYKYYMTIPKPISEKRIFKPEVFKGLRSKDIIPPVNQPSQPTQPAQPIQEAQQPKAGPSGARRKIKPPSVDIALGAPGCSSSTQATRRSSRKTSKPIRLGAPECSSSPQATPSKGKQSKKKATSKMLAAAAELLEWKNRKAEPDINEKF